MSRRGSFDSVKDFDVSRVRQVVARVDRGYDVVESLTILLLGVSSLVPSELTREGMISKHVTDPSRKVAAAQVASSIGFIELLDD